MSGVNKYKNNTLKIWFKNENHIAWLNEKVCITSPDLISIIDKLTHLPLVNNQLKDDRHKINYLFHFSDKP